MSLRTQAEHTRRLPFAPTTALLVAAILLVSPLAAQWEDDGGFYGVQSYQREAVEDKQRIDEAAEATEDAQARLEDLQALPKRERLRVGVLDMSLKAPDAEAFIGTGISEMLITALRDTGRYTVIDRAVTADLIGEQDLDLSGRMARGSGPRAGRLKGVRLWITGSVTEFKEEESGSGFGIGIKGLGLGIRNTKAVVGVDLRVVDAETGEVIESGSRRAELDSRGTSIMGSKGDLALNWDVYKNSPMGQAARDVVTQLVVFIDDAVTRHRISPDMAPWRGRVVTVMDDGRVVLNGGRNQDLATGMRLEVYREHEVFMDPETGEILGADRSAMGIVEIHDAREKFSYARPVQGGGFAPNDAVEQLK